MPLDAKQEALFASVVENISTAFTNSLSKLLNQKLSATLANIGDARVQNGQATVSEPTVHAAASFTESSFGYIQLLINAQEASTVANLMMGDSTVGGDFTADKQEAFSSALNQSFTEAINQSISDATFLPNSFQAELIDPSNSQVSQDGNYEKLGVDFLVQSDSDLNFNISISLATALAQALTKLAPEVNTSQPDNGPETVGDVLGADFAQIVDSHNPQEVDERHNLNLLMDIRLGLIVELGRAEMHLRDILKLTKGSIIELDRLSGEAVDLFVNNKLVARGEVVVIDDNFGLRITQLAGTAAATLDASALAG